MAKMYDLCIFGPDEPGLWLAASAAAGRFLRVALLVSPLPDAGLPCFPHLPLDPARLSPLASAFEFRPAPSPFPPFLPELQVIVAGRPLDLIADPGYFQSGLERDRQDRAAPFLARTAELERMAETAMAETLEQNFPGEPPAPENPARWRQWGKPKKWQPAPSPPWSQWSSALPADERAVIAACATAWLGFPLPADAETLAVALGWKLCRSLHHGDGDATDLRDTAAARVSQRGAVIEAGLEAVLAKGENHSLRLQGGTVIQTQALMGPQSALARLFGERRELPGPLALRRTFFLKLDRDTIPDCLAPRALAVADPTKPTMGENLLLLARAPRAPRRETLAVTLFHPPAHLKVEDLPELLAAALPWVNPKLVTPDETREPVSALIHPPRALQRETTPPALPFPNLWPLPSEALPSWGLWGTVLAARQGLPPG
jgi:hypothetical protein